MFTFRRKKPDPIRWGKPDRELANSVLWSIAKVTPRTTLPFAPGMEPRVRELYARHGIPL